MTETATGWWHEFARGALKPSLGGVLGTVAVALGILLMLIFLITPEFIASKDCGYFLANPNDSYAYLTAETLRLASTESENPCVILVGSSAMREAISNVAELEEELANRLGYKVEVYRLTAEGLKLWEISSMVDTIAEKTQGIVVAGISPKQLAYDQIYLEDLARAPRLALDSQSFWDDLKAEGLERPNRRNVFFIDHYRFFVARPSALLSLIRGPLRLRHHRTGDWRSVTGEAFERDCQRRMNWKESYDERHDLNLGVYERMASRIEERDGLELVLLDAIRNPLYLNYIEATPEAKKYRNRYYSDLETFAEKHGVQYLELGKTVQLEADDFVDTSHIRNPEARGRYTKALAQKLADMFEKRRPKLASLREEAV